jgi:uncharacterized repeat protein (TIGR01451 family)
MLISGCLLVAQPALAALTIDSASVNGASATAVAPGGSIPVTINVTNDASNNWDSTGWAIATSAPPSYTCNNHTDHVGANQSATESFVITAPGTTGTYNAYFKASSNSSCSGNTTVASLPAGIIVAAPTLSKISSSASAVIGDVVTFKVTATNPLSVALNSIVITDTLPTGMTYSTSVATLGTVSNSGQTITWSIPSIPANGSADLTLAVTLTATGTLTNSASSTGSTSVSASILVLAKAATHFRLDEAVGSWNGTPGEVIDSGGTGLKGKRSITTGTTTATNTVSPAPTIASQYSAVVGGFCNAGSFDGKAVVQVGTTPLLQYTNKLSATAWIYPTAYPSSDLYSILSNDTNYEFHLDTNGKLFWWWSSASLTSNTTIPLNKWTHVAITMDSSNSGGRERIYINGVQDTNTENWKGTLTNNGCDFYIGGDVMTDGHCSFATGRTFRGMIDEVKLYDYELSANEVKADMTLGRTCSGNFDHIRIEHDGNASICNPETVTIKACLDSNCSALYTGSVTVNLSPGSGWTNGNIFTFSGGVATRDLSASSVGTVTLGTNSVSPTPSNATRCFKGSTESCNLTFNNASCTFDAIEVGASPATHIYTKLAGTPFKLDVVALSSSTTVNTTFTGTATVDLVDSSSTTCPTGSGLGSSSSITFAASDKGRVKQVSFNYPNAARNVRVRILKSGSTTPACSSDNFAIRPTQLAVTAPTLTNATLTGTPKATAGSAFSLTATASSISSGYDGTPAIDASKVVDHNNTTIASGTLSGNFDAATGISATGNTFKYLDVGNIKFNTDAVTDTGFTSVDQYADCIQNSTSNSLSGGKYGCNIGSTASALMGRWYPSHYSFTGTLTPACTAGNFTYMAQDALGATLTFRAHASTGGTASASDPVTSRYTTGYTNLAEVTLAGDNNSGTAVSVTRLGSPAFPTMPNKALWLAGVFGINDTYAFSKLASPDGPYDSFKLQASINDPDGSTLIGTTAQQATNTTSIRHGRLRIGNAYGSELLDLAIPFEAQYWVSAGSSGYFATNRLDTCTSITPSSIIFSNFTNNLSACETHLSPSTAQTLSSGKLALTLTKPGIDTSNVPNRGSVLLTLNTGSSASGNTCISGTSSAATAGNLSWFGNNPSGTATFGVFRSPYIYLRESY